MHAFVTGGSGFIGRYLIRQLIERKYTVTALVRSKPGAAAVLALGATPSYGDVTDIASLEAGMADVDVVFHLAAYYAVGGFSAEANSAQKMAAVNVVGTHNVLTVAQALDIPKVVVTSSIAVFGDTGGLLVHEDDLQLPRFAERTHFLTAYERTKWEAHYNVVQAFVARGAPVVSVLPSVVYGLDGSGGIVNTLLRAVRSKLPVVPGSDTQVALVHAADVAQGLILAAEQGKRGESYILAGDVMTVGALVKLVSAICGQKAPQLLSSRTLKPFVRWAQRGGVDLEMLNLMGVSYIAAAEKARRELGWKSRPLFEGLTEVVNLASLPTKPKSYLPFEKSTALTVLMGLLLLWQATRRSAPRTL